MAYNSNPPKQQYTANVGQTAFPFLFKIFFDTDIKVYLTPLATGVTAQLTLTTDYTVAISGDDGGEVTLLAGLATGDILVLQRELSIDRLVDYQTNGDLLAETLNNDQDYQTYLVADGTAKLEDTFSIESGTPNIDTTLPSPVTDAYIKWNTAGNALENDTESPSWATATELSKWEAVAAQMTSDSYATEPEDVFVKLWTSDGDGTYSSTDTTEYSSLHWAAKADASPGPYLPLDGTSPMTGAIQLAGGSEGAVKFSTLWYAGLLPLSNAFAIHDETNDVSSIRINIGSKPLLLDTTNISWDGSPILTTTNGSLLPTSDPLVVGSFWNNAGIVTVSAG